MKSVPFRLLFFVAVLILLPAYFGTTGHVAWAQESQSENCNNDVDDDGDGLIDSDDPDCPCQFESDGGIDSPVPLQAFGGFATCTFHADPNGPVTRRADFPGKHSFKLTVQVNADFEVTITPILLLDSVACPDPNNPLTCRYPDTQEKCVPYVDATSTMPGACTEYVVSSTAGPGDFTGNVVYTVAYDHPTLAEYPPPGTLFNNPRLVRDPDEDAPDNHFFDITTAVFPELKSGKDPGVRGDGDGFSNYAVVHQPGVTGTFLVPSQTGVNVFNQGRTIPVQVRLSDPSLTNADLRISVSDSDGIPQEINASGGSSIPNQLRFVRSKKGNYYLFNLQTTNLATGDHFLTVSAGTSSGALWTTQTVEFTLR